MDRKWWNNSYIVEIKVKDIIKDLRWHFISEKCNSLYPRWRTWDLESYRKRFFDSDNQWVWVSNLFFFERGVRSHPTHPSFRRPWKWSYIISVEMTIWFQCIMYCISGHILKENCKINFRSVQTEHPLIIWVKESFSITF
jgi:hypothetical protein